MRRLLPFGGKDGEDLNKKGSHDPKAWVNGRAVHDGIAERTRLLANSYEVWSE